MIYRHKYLSMSEMVKNLLAGEGFSAIVRARDPFGAFTPGPHLATYQPTPASVYEVLVPVEQAEAAKELIAGIVQDQTGERAEND